MYKRPAGILAAGFALAAGALLGQAPEAGLAFEVATIRAAPSIQNVAQQIQSGKAKIGISVDGARVDMGFQSLADLIRIAYDVKPYQVQGPDWMAQQRFEIQAKIPEGVYPDKVPEMLQALLADRFKLTIHRGKKDLPVYALVVGKNGPKLTPASDTPDVPLPDSPGATTRGTEKGQMKMVQDGKGSGQMQVAGQPGTTRYSVVNGAIHLEMTKATVAAIIELLTSLVDLDRPVVDMTELKGTYQVSLELPMDGLQAVMQKQAAALGLPLPSPPPGASLGDAASTPGGSALFAAVEKLGLKLEGRKAPVETIVVDHLEKTPTDN
jgi:uncharacterized protein (TIGR03435 family)